MAERQRIFARIREMQEAGLRIRKPKETLALDKLRERLAEFETQFGKMERQPPRPKPKARARPKPKPKPKAPAPAKPKAAPAQKPKAPPKAVIRDDDDYTSDEDNVPGPTIKAIKGSKPVFHTLYYSGLAAGGKIAGKLGRPEFDHLGTVAKANEAVLDPVLSEIAKDLGLGDGLPLPAEARLAMMTGCMAAACFTNSRPDDVPEPVLAAVELGGAFFMLNLAASAPGSPARKARQ